jgi:hypothetical protein
MYLLSGTVVPRKRETCLECRGYGYLHLLDRTTDDAENVVACGCPAGIQFLKAWRRELAKLSPPAEGEASPVDSEWDTNEDIRE